MHSGAKSLPDTSVRRDESCTPASPASPPGRGVALLPSLYTTPSMDSAGSGRLAVGNSNSSVVHLCRSKGYMSAATKFFLSIVILARNPKVPRKGFPNRRYPWSQWGLMSGRRALLTRLGFTAGGLAAGLPPLSAGSAQAGVGAQVLIFA